VIAAFELLGKYSGDPDFQFLPMEMKEALEDLRMVDCPPDPVRKLNEWRRLRFVNQTLPPK